MTVVVLTAAAHRGGKDIALALADAGCDLAFWGLAAMRTRVRDVEARGGGGGVRAVAVRGNINDPVSVGFLLRDTLAVFPSSSVPVVVHVASHELVGGADGLDASTSGLLAHGLERVVFVDDGEGGDVASLSDAARARGLAVTVVAGVSDGRRRQTAAVAAEVVAAVTGR